jgi:hypothetical protein
MAFNDGFGVNSYEGTCTGSAQNLNTLLAPHQPIVQLFAITVPSGEAAITVGDSANQKFTIAAGSTFIFPRLQLNEETRGYDLSKIYVLGTNTKKFNVVTEG